MYQPSLSSYRLKLIMITALITMVITSVVWVGIGAAGYWFMNSKPPSFEIEVDHPGVVELGEIMDLKISVKNTGAGSISLANVDIYDEFADGFEILDVIPTPGSSERISGYYSYNLFKSLAPGEAHVLTLKMRAKAVGLWSGDIDACNALQNWVTHFTEIEVIDAVVKKNPRAEIDSPDGDNSED
jgi:hypothetical protein